MALAHSVGDFCELPKRGSRVTIAWRDRHHTGELETGVGGDGDGNRGRPHRDARRLDPGG